MSEHLSRLEKSQRDQYEFIFSQKDGQIDTKINTDMCIYMN